MVISKTTEPEVSAVVVMALVSQPLKKRKIKTNLFLANAQKV